MDLQFLPHIVVTNPHIRKVYDSYQHAFDTLHNLSPVKTVEQNAEFTLLLKRLVDEHGQSSLLLSVQWSLSPTPNNAYATTLDQCAAFQPRALVDPIDLLKTSLSGAARPALHLHSSCGIHLHDCDCSAAIHSVNDSTVSYPLLFMGFCFCHTSPLPHAE